MQPHPGMCGSLIKMTHWLVPVDFVCLHDLSSAAFPLLTLFLRILQGLLIKSTAFLSYLHPSLPTSLCFQALSFQSSHRFPLFHGKCPSSVLFCYCVEHRDQKQFGGWGKDLFSFTCYNRASREDRTGTQGRSLQ